MALVLASVAAFATGRGTSAGAVAPALVWTSTTATTGPPALTDPAMAYDSDINAVVLYGGTLADGSLSDQTWVFNGTSWTEAAPSYGPGPRTGASMAFDSSAHQLILFGGIGTAGTYLDDTWAWNGVSWSQATGSTTTPPGREAAALAPDAAGNLVLFGGTGLPASTSGVSSPTPTSPTTVASATSDDSTSTAVTLDDTWTWNGTKWQEAVTPPTLTARTGASVAFDPLHNQTVLYGGSSVPDGSGIAPAPVGGGTWIWNGSDWTPSTPAGGPPARSAAALVADPEAGGAILFGGRSATTELGDTWVWDGSTWSQLAAITEPPATAGAGAAWDSATDQVVLFGGIASNGQAVSSTYLLGRPPTTPPTSTPTTTTTTVPTPVTTPTVISPSGPPRTTPTSRPHTSHPTTLPARTPTTPTTVAPAPPASPPAPSSVPAVQTVHPGSSVLLLGAGFRPGARISVTFHSVPQNIGSFTADDSGSFSVTVTVPMGALAGTHHFIMRGPGPTGSMTTISTAVLVVALAADHKGGSLQTPIMVGIAILLPVGTWFALGLLGRRRTGATGPE